MPTERLWEVEYKIPGALVTLPPIAGRVHIPFSLLCLTP